MDKWKFFIVALAFVACAYADVSELGYSYNHPAPAPVTTYVPPAPVAPAPAPVAPVNTYIPPAPAPAPVAPVTTYVPPAPVAPVQEPVNTYIPPVQVAPQVNPIEEIEQTPVDGYRYKTARRVVYRHRF
ncbi:uncharacterized protein LOC133330783 [Musca vetustissima]|uniref:uncharacterized protein LOC133330783 n=1 Tax=Musca vetustissima TaxID=27455 RepID=UPI002AB78893|nr:uncharacterized protein LOC133330783 [Musca vetustissima]